jgi:foldase protein PrsA
VRRFLETSGQTEPELIKRVKAELLSNKIRDKVVRGKNGPKPTPTAEK